MKPPHTASINDSSSLDVKLSIDDIHQMQAELPKAPINNQAGRNARR
jgi:hypothetical protein